VAERVGEIAALGAHILWLLPIHPIGVAARKGRSGSPYAIRDYRAVNPEYGTMDDLVHLVGAAHGAGLKVILDCVLNHGAPDHVERARHPDWFARDRRGRPTRRVADWHDVVDWDFSAPGLEAHLLDAVAFWVREAGIDGYRCDVAGMVPASFWRAARTRLAAIRPDFLLLAEWDDPGIHRTGFHASYDWELYRAMRRVVRGDRPAHVLADIVARRARTFPDHAMPLRFVENHDELRAPQRLGAAARPLAAFAALAGGLFLVYNGQEVGARHRPNLFEVDPIEWAPPGASAERAWWRALLAERAGLATHGPAEVVATGHPDLAAYRRPSPGGDRVVVYNGSPAPIAWRPEGARSSRVVEPGPGPWPEISTAEARIPGKGATIFAIN
jgi:glycosidase